MAAVRTASVGLPTGSYDASYKGDILTQEKQLGFGRVTGALMLDHTMDQTWGLVVLGGLISYRGGENSLQSYRAPMGSLYAYAGYFAGPFVPAVGVSVVDFIAPDRDRTLQQDVPLTLFAGNASLEWSTDTVAILAGVSLPYSLRGTIAMERGGRYFCLAFLRMTWSYLDDPVDGALRWPSSSSSGSRSSAWLLPRTPTFGGTLRQGARWCARARY